jgi:hypothetical protein
VRSQFPAHTAGFCERTGAPEAGARGEGGQAVSSTARAGCGRGRDGRECGRGHRDAQNVTVRPGSTRLSRVSRDAPRLMGRKLNYVFSFRPINIRGARRGDERAKPLDFPAKPTRPGRLVAATACPGRHETPGDLSRTAARAPNRPVRPRCTRALAASSQLATTVGVKCELAGWRRASAQGGS